MWTNEQAEVLAAVFGALNQSGIKWLVLRNYEGLPESNRSKDIDLAFLKEDFTRAGAIIANEMLIAGFDRVHIENFQYVRCLTFFKILEKNVISIKIDLLDGFVWRGAQLFSFDQMYESRVAYRNFFVPDKVDDAVMLWMKPLLTGGIIKKNYVKDILSVVDSNPEKFRLRLKNTFGECLTKEVWPLIKQGYLEDTITYQHSLAWSAWRRSAKNQFISTIFESIKHIYFEIIRRSKRSTFSMIAVVGPDGVGKTTFINLLQQEMSRVMVKDLNAIQVIHFRPSILPNIKKLLSGKQYDSSKEEFSSPHRAAPASFPSSLVRLVYYWFDYFFGYWFVNRRKCVKGNLLVFDRYYYDFIVDPRRSRINLPPCIRNLFLFLTPLPDFVFFLDCDPDVVYARKQELERDEIERQLIEYRKLALKYSNRFIRLDALKPPQSSCQHAFRVLVERSFPRVSTLQ